VAKAKTIEGLAADDSYGEAAARIIASRSEELIGEARGVLDTGDIDRVHDMRVATRRLRAALEVFEPCFPRKPLRQALREVKRLADALGERRDRDVGILALRRFNDQMPAPDRPGVESLIERLRDEQADANLELAPLVDQGRLTALKQSLDELVGAARGRSEPAPEGGAG
jgi:CHAD domain-containing protein